MENINGYYAGIGKRKTSVAKVFLKQGSGIISINKKSFEEFSFQGHALIVCKFEYTSLYIFYL